MGPYVGVSLTIQPVCQFWFSLMYDYHWLSFLEKTNFDIQGIFVTGPLASDLSQLYNSARNTTLQARGHKGWLKARYEIDSHWNIDLLAYFLYYSTHYATTYLAARILSNFFNIDTPFDLGTRAKARWTSFTRILNPSYKF